MDEFEKRILIIEDDIGLQSQLKWHFDDFDSTIITANNVDEALTAVRHYQPNIVIQDLGLPPDPEGVSEGFRCIEEILVLIPTVKIIVLTGKSEHQNALRSIELGAFDFYYKPVTPETLDHTVNQAVKISKLEWENQQAGQSHEEIEVLEGLVTGNVRMKNICRMVQKIGRSKITTTILGESGTGKEVIARAIHTESNESDGPFVAINCAAVPEALMESELFGHEKGSFTGANKASIGKIEQAQNGTLFLDEIGDMPLNLQAKLLRFLQQRTIEKVGGRKEIEINARVICATNKDLKAMSAAGTFREDLYYRICEIVVELPPLRERGEDSLLIATHLLKKQSKVLGINHLKLSSDAMESIAHYSWPGNIRELENKIKRASVLTEGKTITSVDLDLEATTDPKPSAMNLKQARRTAEMDAIKSALEVSQQNVSAAAKILGVSRPTLYDMMKKYSITLTDTN